MAKIGKKAKIVVCYCDKTSNKEGTKCECWDTKGNPIVLANLVRIRGKGPRYIPSTKRFR